ncbi:MAG: flagellar biosynthetic protein FliR [Methylocystis sp.]|nr:flagellar biosynthetic protein FliR [Methylocystis sp.]
MNAPEELLMRSFVLFCRIGGCLMMTPGFSSERTPVRVRLAISLAVTAALAPGLLDLVEADVVADKSGFAKAIVAELAIGVFLGILARLYLLALETLGGAVSMTIGLGNIFGPPIHDTEAAAPLAAFVTLGAVTLIFVVDLHLEIIRGLHLSYQAAPILSAPRADIMLEEIVNVLAQSHLLALRISSPFLIFGLIANLAFGFLAKFTPQAPIYFVSGPFVIIAGIYAFSILSPDFFSGFIAQFGAWLARG